MKSPLLSAVFSFAALAIALIMIPGGEVRAQGTADISLEQQIQAALADAGFDPGPVDGKFGPATRRAISQWQSANGHAATGFLTGEQLRTILAETTPTVTLVPKCAELSGQFEAENHAECWNEVDNQRGCFVWDHHYHSDRVTKWTGRCRSGVAEGRGVLSVSAGSEHAPSQGTGTLLGGKANGHWEITWANGERYEGEFRDGRRTGYGTYSWPGGARYEGDFRDAVKHGFGTQTWPNGHRYEGDFLDGKITGRGTYTYPDGIRYEGDFRDGVKHGVGTQTWPGGYRYVGDFRHDKPHGFGTLAGPDRHYEGQWRNGCSGRDGKHLLWINTTADACGFE